MILHQIEALVKVSAFGDTEQRRVLTDDRSCTPCARACSLSVQQAGVKDVVLAVNYRPEVMVALLSKCEEQYGIKITFSVESEPLGTGALR